MAVRSLRPNPVLRLVEAARAPAASFESCFSDGFPRVPYGGALRVSGGARFVLFYGR